MNKTKLTTLLSVITVLAFGQSSPNLFDFTQTNNVPVIHSNDSLANAWAGGVNYAQIGTMDLNMDNVEDLVIYDRHTRQTATYVRTGNTYKYAPEYRERFPRALSWMLIRDYNCDGKKDIFFNVGSDIQVWKNTSSSTLSFVDVTNGPLQSYYSNASSNLNLYVPSGDIPGIADIDGDGDLDILTFENGANIMEYHENKGNCDLDFELEERCWGHFIESGFYREVSLNSCTPFKKKTLHSGSTILPIDLNGDDVQDLILGNISYTEMVAMYNGGNADSAHFTSQDTLFPSYDTPIDVFQFPAAFYEDVNFDGKPDLIISPADLSDGGADRQSVHLYKNTGTASNPYFEYVRDDFMQNQTIDLGKGAVPRLVDLNGDSLLDLVVANYQAFTSPTTSTHFYYYYTNTGTATQPRFTLQDTNFANVSSYPGLEKESIPCFGDLDGDGDQDMIVGDENGNLYYFTNSSASQPNFTFQSPLSGVSPGNSAAPFLFDMDSDGDLDLLVGNESGKVLYYTNSSASNPSFTLTNSNFGGIDVSLGNSGGNSIPYAFEENGSVNLFVGSDEGGVFQFDSIGKVMNLPSTVDGTVGTGTLTPAGSDLTPFGFINKAGRNQYLVRASELRAAGLDYGYISSVAFDVASSSNARVYPRFSLKIKATQDSVLTGFATGLTEVFNSNYELLLPQGWTAIDFFSFKHFLWDGTSNLIVEVCFSEMSYTTNNIPVRMTDVGYDCNAYGQYIDRKIGCTQTLKGLSQARPNMRFKQVPAALESSRYGSARRAAPAISDLDDDGYVDMILGNFGGGLFYYRGEEYKVSLPESEAITREQLTVFPNPGTGIFTIALTNESTSVLSVFDLTGRMVMQKEIAEKEAIIDLASQADGIYLFVLQTSEGIKTQKVIKQ